ncbi:UDP-glycosyltransferase 83A1 isoform X2 [Jatropha curcas]|uniref:UDP-glycosyltransferase 83A1 isoform X2 n=1 Tax=Jatropha curcas TaxID=180498 RepID=UPI001893E88B|nr:UDP-glycosyltransferase 83A1 isoform X2 [Jatropha curcas]
MDRKAHVMIIPYPSQGHVGPLMKLAYNLADEGFKVTFVNTESIHTKIMSAIPQEFEEHSLISLVSVPEGLEFNRHGKDRFEEVAERFDHLKNLIEKINRLENDEPITHVIADISVGWALQVSKKMGIKSTAFVPYGSANFALVLQFPKLIEAGIMDVNACELEQSACDLIPNAIPIGPLHASNHFAGNLWPEDSTCLTWLDRQPNGSVIYLAFGSTVVYNKQQFNELAFGLEITGQPFLWVVRSDFTEAEFPDGFLERTANSGKIVKWAPQEKVLAHTSISCFVSHCGWNSTMEGLSMGVPFLCWPYCADQFHNKDTICKNWKVGVGLVPDENGIVTRDEIKGKIEQLVSDKDIKVNSLKLKKMARKSISEGGSSFKNFLSFVEQIKKF